MDPSFYLGPDMQPSQNATGLYSTALASLDNYWSLLFFCEFYLVILGGALYRIVTTFTKTLPFAYDKYAVRVLLSTLVGLCLGTQTLDSSLELFSVGRCSLFHSEY